jgi:hypothetical protein
MRRAVLDVSAAHEMEIADFKKLYFSAPIRFIWEWSVVDDYVPVIERAIYETVRSLSFWGIEVDRPELGAVIIRVNGNSEDRLAVYINNRRIKDVGSLYSEFRRQFRIVALGYDDSFDIPIPPSNKKSCVEFFLKQGWTEEEAIKYWQEKQNLIRPIKNFKTLANKSVNRRRLVPPKLRLQVLARDNFKCFLCGRTSDETVLHVDHITPVSKGGSNDIEHLATLCQECNLGKGNQLVSDILKAKSR